MGTRVFVGDSAASLAAGADHALSGEAARHVGQALRMRAGDALTLFTGAGGEYEATIARIDRHGVVVRVGRHRAIERESAPPVTLVQALIAADMMDFVVRKAVELGAVDIVPVQTARSQGLSGERMARRIAHWRKVAIAACEQCGRNRIPPVHDVVTFAEWLRSDASGRAAILDARAPRSLAALALAELPGAIACGPEGGFTDEELAAAAARGLRTAHLGPRVLRAETAPLAALATLAAVADDSTSASGRK